MKKIYLILFLLLVFSNIVFAQKDSLKKEVKTVIKVEDTKSPSTAIYLSLAMPGLGQYYVKSYWKAPIFFGGAVGCYYGIFSNHSKYISKEKEWINAKNETKPDAYKIEYLRRWKEQYRDWRDQSGMYLIGVYLLASVDAYVDAHLYNFDVNEKVSLNFNLQNDSPRFCLSYHF